MNKMTGQYPPKVAPPSDIDDDPDPDHTGQLLQGPARGAGRDILRAYAEQTGGFRSH
jgi:hypothetical protein